MRIKAFCLLILLTFCVKAKAQYIDHDFYNYTRPYFYSGYLGVELGIVNRFEGAALAGYRFADRVMIGGGAKYMFYRSKVMYNLFDAHIYGPVLFAQTKVIRNMDDLVPFNFLDAALIVHTEADFFILPVNYFNSDNYTGTKNRFIRPTYLAGIGVSRNAGVNRDLYMMILFNLSNHKQPVYQNAFIRIGMNF